ncbi:MAG: alkaline phosphatase family protein [Candidatus Methylomirabilales bacterium]
MRIRTILIGLLLSLLVTDRVPVTQADPPVRRVIVISIDGARPDGLLATRTPTITRLWKQGAYSFRAQTISPSTTLPAHTSMLTGISPDRHGERDNSWWPGEATVAVETVFSLAKSRGLKTAMVVTKEKFGFLARPGSLDHFELVPHLAPDVVLRALAYLRSEKPHLLFMHFTDADITGHLYGWMSPEYLIALQTVDDAVEILLRTMEETRLVRETLLIITADHGGHDFTHGTTLPEDMTIPWIAVGPGVREGYEIPDQVVIYDTAATVLLFLGIPIPAHWDGRPLRSIFRP